jgi:hypothetical protein
MKDQNKNSTTAVFANTNAGKAKPNIINPLVSYSKGDMSIQDLLAPQDFEVDFSYVKIGETYLRTIFVGGYPRFVTPGWLEPVINFNHSMDISFYIYPVDGKTVLDDLKRKITEMEAEMSTDMQRGKRNNNKKSFSKDVFLFNHLCNKSPI